jgi:hypothetical protein
LLPLACAVAIVAAGGGLAYVTFYRRNFAAGLCDGLESSQTKVWLENHSRWRANGRAEAALSINLWLVDGKLDGSKIGWCMLKLGEKPTDTYGSPIEDVMVMRRGRQYALNVDGTIWYRE